MVTRFLPPQPQFKRYTISDDPPTGLVRASSPACKLRKNQEQKSSSISINTSEQVRRRDGPPKRNRPADDMGRVSTPPVPIVRGDGCEKIFTVCLLCHFV